MIDKKLLIITKMIKEQLYANKIKLADLIKNKKDNHSKDKVQDDNSR